MQQLGMITIGQAPRTDVAPIIEQHLGNRAQLVQVGVLDGYTKTHIEEKLSPGPGDYVLTSRLTNGESVVMSREKIQPILQTKIDELEKRGITQILLLCTGVFPGLTTSKSYLIEPDHIIPPTVKAMVGSRRLGVLVPLQEQKETLKAKYEPVGLHPFFAVASPYHKQREPFLQAAETFKDRVDIVLMDCMGYTEESRQWVAGASGMPVVLSNALMAKLVSEMI